MIHIIIGINDTDENVAAWQSLASQWFITRFGTKVRSPVFIDVYIYTRD